MLAVRARSTYSVVRGFSSLSISSNAQASTSTSTANAIPTLEASTGRKKRAPLRRSSDRAQGVSGTVTSSVAPTGPAATHYLVTLQRSAMGLPTYASRTLESLGLKKRYSCVLHPFSATTAGQILRVKELVKVENVTEERGLSLLKSRSDRSEGSGVQPVGRVFGGSKKHKQ